MSDSSISDGETPGGQTHLDDTDWHLLGALVPASLRSPLGVVANRFRVEHEPHREALDNLERYGYIERDPVYYHLRVPTLEYLRSRYPAAEELLGHCEKLFTVLRDGYRENPGVALSLEDAASRAGLSVEDARRGLGYLVRECIVEKSSTGPAPFEMSVTASEKVLDSKSWAGFLEDSVRRHGDFMNSDVFGPGAFKAPIPEWEVGSDENGAPSGLTAWPKIDRQLQEMREALSSAKTEQQFQAIGLLCREIAISTGQAVHDPARHVLPDGCVPSSSDAKRLLESFFETELAGSGCTEVRSFAKAAIALANALQHKRTADSLTAAMCAEAATSVASLAAIVYNTKRKSDGL